MYLLFGSSFFISLKELGATDFVLNGIFLFLTVGIGHSVGLHRGVIHRSYRSSRMFRNVSIYLFVLTGMGSPLN